MATLRFHASDGDAGARLDRVLSTRPEVGTRAAAVRLIGDGAVAVDGRARPKSHRLEVGELVEVVLPAEPTLAPEALPLRVAYEDEHLLVVDKPAGVVVHPTGRPVPGTLAGGLLALGAAGGEEGRPGIVHRLDRDTSGLLLVARSEEAHRRLSRLIRRREVERRYLALVRGEPRSRTGRIEAPIGRDRRDRTRHSLDTATPRQAVTWFELREQLPAHALLEVRLETGRTHQIRVHLEAIDLPVAGDPVYGVKGDLRLGRQFLHAHRLRFEHPYTGEELDVSSPLPEDLAEALERARGPATP
ncbi:MAG TPA: RluA family pseudouridine synthase [Gaiellaceae bacterium]|nr:RluA family pseudouridine synthase [Gaiellaceae bacterium]